MASQPTLAAPAKSAPTRKAIAFLITRWPECGLALAMLAAILVSGCKSGYCWTGPDGHTRYTSDPPESYPAEERINAHPAEWR